MASARTRPTAPGAVVRLLVGATVASLLLVVGAAGAGAAEAPAHAPTLGAVLDGEVDGLAATALTDFDGADPDGPWMQVSVTVENDGDEATAVAVPFGTLLATDDEADQTVAVAGPTDAADLARVAASGGTPAITAEPGDTTVLLTVYCAELDDGAPMDPTPLHHVGQAAEPLPTVLRNIAAQQPDDGLAQDAVWWVTDHPTVPVRSDLAPLLEGVDVEAFAAAPHRVVPDSAYVPGWACPGDQQTVVPPEERAAVYDEAFDGGTQAQARPVTTTGAGGLGTGVWLALAALAGIGALVIVLARAGRDRTPSTVPATGGPTAPGWYPDPWARGGHRWWDGRTWTARTLPPR